jgi:(2S)-methylsuccinyl-CoA dehydrogenase
VSIESINRVVGVLERVVAAQRTETAARMTDARGAFSRDLLDANQPEAFELARAMAELESARASARFAARHQGAWETALAGVFVAMAAQRTITRSATSAAAADADLAELRAFAASTLSTANLTGLGDELRARTGEYTGAYGLSRDHEEMRRTFARFADTRIEPLAEHIHRHDDILPEPLLRDLAELGVFGISIPEEYGGNFVDHLTMCLATEELSRASVGAGGSVITRPEICSKALLKGGTEEQKQRFLPAIAAGQLLTSIAVTEPNAGSDVAAVRVTAKRVHDGWVINGEKTWCTFAGRANLLCLLARTGSLDEGARGLTLFIVEKEPTISETDHHSFKCTQPGGGTMEGHAIPTIGYRGMHSFAVSLEDWFVPDSNRIGALGTGFALQMEGFAGGRIQTAARAVGLMEAAFRKAITYATERKVFGKPLAEYSLSSAKLVQMAAVIQAARQLTYQVCEMMDGGEGGMEASLVKLLACRDAEWVTREAMQLHGGMGYSEEYAVSRYFQDARVLSIFEGAEEVLAIYVVARQALRDTIGK